MQANEGESSLSLERIRHVSDLMQIGNQAFRENSFEEVVVLLFVQSCVIRFWFQFLNGVGCFSSPLAFLPPFSTCNLILSYSHSPLTRNLFPFLQYLGNFSCYGSL